MRVRADASVDGNPLLFQPWSGQHADGLVAGASALVRLLPDGVTPRCRDEVGPHGRYLQDTGGQR